MAPFVTAHYSEKNSTGFTSGYFLGDTGTDDPHDQQHSCNPTIPQGSTIISATLTFRAGASDTSTVVNTTIIGLDADDISLATTTAQWNATTSASVAWNGISAWTFSNYYTSPSIVTIVQEIVNRTGFHSGQHLCVTVRDNGSSANAHREVWPAYFTITWTAPAAKTISGNITLGGVGLDGVTMTYSGGVGTTVTSGGGNYTKTVPHDWTGTVTPSKLGEVFNPAYRSYSYVQSNQTGQNYTAYVHPIMSGTVKRWGTGIDGVTITVSDVGTVNTSGGGAWTKSVPYNWTGTLTPSKAGESFAPTYLSHNNQTADEANQDFTMLMYALPIISIAYTTHAPEYSYLLIPPTVNIVYTTYPPSRNYYNVGTASIVYTAYAPEYDKGFVDIRSRFKLNAIGKRISLKYSNVGSSYITLTSMGILSEEYYRRDSKKLNAKGERITMKFQNNGSATPFELQYLRVFDEVYTHQIGTNMNVKGNHLSFKFQNKTATTPFELQYMKIKGDVYENQ